MSIVQGAAGFLVEDVTITPAYPNDRLNGINVNQPGTIRRCNISGTVDGVMIYGNSVTIEDSYLHDFATLPTTTQADGKPTTTACRSKPDRHRHSPQQHQAARQMARSSSPRTPGPSGI